MESNPQSNCCNAPVTIGGEGSTHYYVCTKCGEACDTATPQSELREPPIIMQLLTDIRAVDIEKLAELNKDELKDQLLEIFGTLEMDIAMDLPRVLSSLRQEWVEAFAEQLKSSYLVQPRPGAKLGMSRNGMKLTEYPEVIALIDDLLALFRKSKQK